MQIHVGHPARTGGRWYLDDPAGEYLPIYFNRMGINDIMDKIVAETPGSASGVRLSFADEPFVGHRFTLARQEAAEGGYWYYAQELKLMGWLGHELKRFFPEFPERIYVACEATDAGG